VTIQERLKRKRLDIVSQYEVVQGALVWVALVGGIVLFTAGLALFAALPPVKDSGILDTRIGTNIAVVVLIAGILAAVSAPWSVIPWLTNRYWKRHYQAVWRWLEKTEMAQYVVDERRWEPVFALLEQYPWLKLTGVKRPQSLDEQIELASDYQLALRRLCRKRDSRLFWPVWWGSTTRLADDVTVLLFNSCTVLGCLMFGGALWFTIGFPFWLWAILLYFRRQATQTALIDYFLDNPQPDPE